MRTGVIVKDALGAVKRCSLGRVPPASSANIFLHHFPLDEPNVHPFPEEQVHQVDIPVETTSYQNSKQIFQRAMCHTLLQHYIHCRHTNLHFYHCHVDEPSRCPWPRQSPWSPLSSSSSTSSGSSYSQALGSHPPPPTSRGGARGVRVAHVNYLPPASPPWEHNNPNATKKGDNDPADWRSHDVQLSIAHSYLRKCPACLDEEIAEVIEDVDYLEGLRGRGEGVRRWRVFAGLEVGGRGTGEERTVVDESRRAVSNGDGESGDEDREDEVDAEERDDGDGGEDDEDEGVEDGEDIEEAQDEEMIQVMAIENSNTDTSEPEANSQATSESGGILTPFERALLEETRRTIRALDRRRRLADNNNDGNNVSSTAPPEQGQEVDLVVTISDFAGGQDSGIPLAGDAADTMPEEHRRAIAIVERARAAVEELDRRDAEARRNASRSAVDDTTIVAWVDGNPAGEATVMSGALQRRETPSGTPSAPRSRNRSRPIDQERRRLGPRVRARQQRNGDIMAQAQAAEERIWSQGLEPGRLTPQQRGLLFSGQPLLATIPEELRENVERTLGLARTLGELGNPTANRTYDRPGRRMWIDGAADEEADWNDGGEGSGGNPEQVEAARMTSLDRGFRRRTILVRDAAGVLTTRYLLGSGEEGGRGMANEEAARAVLQQQLDSDLHREDILQHVRASPPRHDTPGNLYNFPTHRRPGEHREAWELNPRHREPPQSSLLHSTTSTLEDLTLGPNDCPCHEPREWGTASSAPTHEGIPNHKETLAMQRDSPAHRSVRLPRQRKEEALSADTWEIAVHFEGCGHDLAVFVEKPTYIDAAQISAQCGCYGFDRCLVALRKGVSRQICLVCRMDRERQVWVSKGTNRDGQDRAPWFEKWVRKIESRREWTLWPFGANDGRA